MPAPKTAPAEPPKGESSAVLKPIKCWSEIVDRVVSRDPAIAAFLRKAKGYQSVDGSITVTVNNTFTRSMLEKDAARAILLSAIAACLRQEVREGALHFEVNEAATVSTDSMIDEILNG